MPPSKPNLVKRSTIVVGLAFLVVAAFLSWAADASLGFGPDQIAYNLLSQELLSALRMGAPLTSEFGSVYRQSFALAHALGQAGFGDPVSSYRAILFAVALTYLFSMYLLMVHVVENRGVAAVTAVLSIVQRYMIGTSFWGMGEFQAILPRIVVLPLVPIAWLLFEKHVGSRRVIVAFVLTALGFGLHLSAVHLYAVLLTTYVLYVLLAKRWIDGTTVLLAAVLLFFSLRTIPSPLWSGTLEGMPYVRFLVPLVGLVLALHYAFGGAKRKLLDAATVLALSVCVVWLAEPEAAASLLGRPQRQSMAESGSIKRESAWTAQRASGEGDLSGVEPPEAGEMAEPIGLHSPEKGELDRSPEKQTLDRNEPRVNQVESTKAVTEVNRAIYARFGWTLFPISFASLMFALWNAGLVGCIALYEFARRWRQGASQRERITGLYLLSVALVGLGITGALQVYSRLTDRPDIVLELFRALRFAYLPMYMYAGMFFERVWHSAPGRGLLIRRLVLVALVLVSLVPPRRALASLPDSLKLYIRSAAAELGALNDDDPSQRYYLDMLLATRDERRQARDRHQDLVLLGSWVRSATPEDSVFLTTDYSFVFHADRDIMISYAQGAGSARSMAVESGYGAWHEAFSAISDALESRQADRILAVASQYEVDYILVEQDQPPLPLPLVYSNRSYMLYERGKGLEREGRRRPGEIRLMMSERRGIWANRRSRTFLGRR